MPFPDVGAPVRAGEAPPEFRARIVSSATLGTMIWWLQNGAAEPPEAVTGWLWKLLQPIWFEQTPPADRDHPNDANPSV